MTMKKNSQRLMLLSAGVAAVFAASTAQASLVALYNYNLPGDLGRDASANGNHLIGSGAPVSVAGKYGGGLDLNGTNATLVSANGGLTNLPTGNSSYTIATWMNADTAGNNGAGGLIGWGNYGTVNEVTAFRMNGNSSLHNYWWGNDLTGFPGIDLTTGSGSAGWHHAAVTYDAISTLNAMYLDGNLIRSRYATGHNAGGANFAVGKTVGSEYFDGQLDDTAIFNQALTRSQITAIMAGNFSAFGVNNVPEPSSLLLTAAALSLVAWVKLPRRSRRNMSGKLSGN